MKAAVVAMLLAATSARADKVVDLPVVPYTLKTSTFSVESFRVVGPGPLITARINKMMSEPWGLGGFIRMASGTKGSVTCEIGFATTTLLSVGCRSSIQSDSQSGGAPNSGIYGVTYLISGDTLTLATADELFGDAKDKVAAVTGKNDQPPAFTCGLDFTGSLYVTPGGIQSNGMQMMAACDVAWDQVLPLLPKDSMLRAIAEHAVSAHPADPRRTWKQDRFDVKGDTAVDKASGLEWATHDNGADITYADAESYATASQLGGHTDWRLPEEGELEQLSEITGLPHVEKNDCTKGKNALMVSPVIHLSCGLAWAKGGDVQMGFISGTPRSVKPTVKVNSRALIVRGKQR